MIRRFSDLETTAAKKDHGDGHGDDSEDSDDISDLGANDGRHALPPEASPALYVVFGVPH